MTLRRAYRRHSRRQPLSPAVREFLEAGQLGANATLDEHLARRGGTLQRFWRVYRGEILPQWIQQRPGSRPWGWWRSGDAPEKARRRLGGVGTPAHEVLAHVEEYDFGIPAHWITPFEAAYYRGAARDMQGHRSAPSIARAGSAALRATPTTHRGSKAKVPISRGTACLTARSVRD
jgi:hypothetical protein